ncbi:Uncharacterised protein [Vibrio cholerae]|nr:Uncharacterised protein [Vibrio cholerae]CRZ96206.1 Uncharacterised protein [Vibrio cholerae]CSB18797.1 Uncharacterised protein [Vibrio cholerae]CSB26622.1 Uncharacterised protein [Vibrio cholerae]CSB26746.1 Uncharacterised protein [Vibrio cholerae]
MPFVRLTGVTDRNSESLHRGQNRLKMREFYLVVRGLLYPQHPRLDSRKLRRQKLECLLNRSALQGCAIVRWHCLPSRLHRRKHGQDPLLNIQQAGNLPLE